MNSIVAKGLILTGGVGGAGLATYGGYLALKGKDSHSTSLTIWQVVSSKKGKFILSTDIATHDTEWDGIISNSSNEQKLKRLFIGALPTKDVLKNWCSKNRTESSKSGDLLSDYESLCTKNSVFGQLKELNKEILGEGDSKWDANFSSYNSKTSSDNRITGDDGVAKNGHTLSKKEELIDWCNKNSRSLYKAETATTKAYIQWCTKDIASASTSIQASRT